MRPSGDVEREPAAGRWRLTGVGPHVTEGVQGSCTLWLGRASIWGARPNAARPKVSGRTQPTMSELSPIWELILFRAERLSLRPIPIDEEQAVGSDLVLEPRSRGAAAALALAVTVAVLLAVVAVIVGQAQVETALAVVNAEALGGIAAR